jgi:hypothetical protein
MRTERDNLILLVSLSLRKGLSSIKGMKKPLTDEQEKRIPETIVHDLETHNWRIHLGPPGRPPG